MSRFLVLTILTILTSSLGFADETLISRFQQFKNEYQMLDRGRAKLGLRNGLVTLYVAGKKRKKFSTEAEIERLHFQIRTPTVDFFGIPLKTRYTFSEVQADAPTLVVHAGFVSDFKSGAVGYLMSGLRERFPEYNLLMIEGLSSGEFSERNCFYSLGGIHEPYLIEGILRDYWQSQPIRNRETIIIGSSSSSFSVIAAPTLINRSEKNEPVRGSFLISGHDSMTSVYRNFVKPEGFFNRIGFTAMNKKYGVQKAPLETAECRAIHQSMTEPNFSGLLENTFQTYQTAFRKAWIDLYGKDMDAGSYADYLDRLSLSEFVPNVKSPFFWLEAKNDPLPVEGQFKRFQKASSEASLIGTDFRKYGGHAAFEVVYGKEWLYGRLELFVKKMASDQ